MTSHTPNQARLPSFNKDPGHVPHSIKVPKAPIASASSGRKQESARARTGGSGIRDDAGVDLCGCASEHLASRYFCPAISSTSNRSTLPESTRKDIIDHLRVTEEERRLFHSWRESATHPSEASKHRARPATEDISPSSEDILHNLRVTDEERHFLQGLRGNI
ncbi:hypothetical protein BDV37DRAFT_288816 [Aspergillus pseudonomiae]|uniref:Uncharacterized protein n=1 Tax=Aspergillus pseudonomiae TaxID=1506151 RepID=A0A5N7CV75_9EURO|nr:uncharacterized protein BDV37DRAFT_288816 [Aspergillus pseudonomiae]KAE8398105.1 hypothetical protein BDV37DRAFT_288816 [Aspergillus pseudonomiae]